MKPAAFKWERELLSAMESGQARAVEERDLPVKQRSTVAWACGLIESDKKVRGWAKLARFLEVSESALRRARRHEPDVSRVIYEDTKGRLWGDPGELTNLLLSGTLWNRREGGLARRLKARAQPHTARGRFA